MKGFNKEESAINYSATRAINGVDAKLVKRDYIAGATDAEEFYLKELEEAKRMLRHIVHTENNTPSEAEEIRAFIDKF